MRNRAKCKICKDILESSHSSDYVTCSCGEIAISGGLQALECYAKNWENFLRIDDSGIVKPIKVVEDKSAEEPIEKEEDPTQEIDYILMLEDMIKHYESLPREAMSVSVTHHDMHAILSLLHNIVKSLRA